MKNTKLVRCVSVAGFLMVGGVGCSSYYSNTVDEIEYRKESSMALLEDSQTAKKHTLFRETDSVYLGKLVFGKNAVKEPMQLNSLVLYAESVPMTLDVALNRVSLDHEIYIYLSDQSKVFLGLKDINTTREQDTSDGANATEDDRAINSQLDELAQTINVLNDLNKKNSQSEVNPSDMLLTNENFAGQIILKSDGMSLKEWLDEFTLERGLFWDYGYVNNRPYVEITATVSENFQYEGPTNKITNAVIEAGTATAWMELKEYVKTSVSEIGTQSASDATGRIYISDRPAVVRKIQNRVDYENNIFNKDILYDLRVLTFRQSENENYQLSWESIVEDLSSKLSFNTGNPSTSTNAFGASYTSFKSGSSATTGALRSILKGGRELFSVGRAQNRSHFKASPIQEASIVTGTSVTATDQGTVVTEETGTVESGVTFDVVGSILSGGRISLDLSATYKDEISRETISGSNGEFSLPTIYTVPIAQQFTLQPGETAIFTNSSTNASVSKTGAHDNFGWANALLGGNSEIITESTLTMVVISARIIGE